MDVNQVSKLVLDILTTDDPVEKERLKKINTPVKIRRTNTTRKGAK